MKAPVKRAAAPLTTGPTFLCNLFFDSSSGEGWSEHYYLIAGDASAAETKMSGLVPLRLALLGPSFRITQGRISDISIKGDSYPFIGIAFPQSGTFAPSTPHPLEANTAINFKLLGTAPMRNMIFLRGLDAVNVRGRDYTSDTPWETALTSYGNYLTDTSNGFQCFAKDASAGMKVFTPIINTGIYGVTARKPGRPFGSPVGRRTPTPPALMRAGAATTTSGAATARK